MIISFAYLITACATPYYGYSKEEWQQLSGEDQQAVQAEYKEIIDYQYRQKHEGKFEARKQQIIRRGTDL